MVRRRVVAALGGVVLGAMISAGGLVSIFSSILKYDDAPIVKEYESVKNTYNALKRSNNDIGSEQITHKKDEMKRLVAPLEAKLKEVGKDLEEIENSSEYKANDKNYDDNMKESSDYVYLGTSLFALSSAVAAFYGRRKE